MSWGGSYIEDIIEDFLSVFGKEGRSARQHFVEQRAQTPPVDGRVVAGALDDLGRQVLGGPTESKGLFPAVHGAFGQPEVRDLHMPGHIE